VEDVPIKGNFHIEDVLFEEDVYIEQNIPFEDIPDVEDKNLTLSLEELKRNVRLSEQTKPRPQPDERKHGSQVHLCHQEEAPKCSSGSGSRNKEDAATQENQTRMRDV
jgi:hypothetical protein